MDDVTFGWNGRDAERWRLHSAMAINYLAIAGRSLISTNACFCLFLVAGGRLIDAHQFLTARYLIVVYSVVSY